jgi:hypothetical protein
VIVRDATGQTLLTAWQLLNTEEVLIGGGSRSEGVP